MNSARGYLTLPAVRGVPVALHWTLLLWLPWYAMQGASLARLILSLSAFVLLMAAHEAGHAVVARRRHVHVREIRLYMLHGLCEHDRPEYELDHILIAWGGVLAQAIVLLVSLLLSFLLLRFAPQIDYFLQPMLAVFIPVNCFIAAFNLLPIKRLDGYLAWRIVPILWRSLRSRTRPHLRLVADTANIKKRRAAERDAQIAADALIDRLKNKQ